MKLLPWLALPLIALSLACPAGAQTAKAPANEATSEAIDAEPSASPSTSASALLIPPRFTVDYNSSGGGYEGFGGFGFMLPVQQRPGQQLDYLQGRLTLTNGADLGGSLLFGHRQRGKCLFGNSDCFIGGYVGVDLTNTGEAAFPQVGLGLEMLGDLEMRLNGYLAVGNTQRRVEEAQFNSPTGMQFQGSNLLFIDQNSRDRFQNALSGFDFELGGKLVRFGNGGDLRGYGAVYSYGGPQIDRYVGGRFRIEVRPNDVLRIGGGVQFDPEFGTNLLFQIAATFPSLGQRRSKAPGPTIDQLADPPLRQTAVVVAERLGAPAIGPTAVDPSTGKTYEFIHVAPGRGNSSGTFEDPMNTIAEATAVTTPSTDIIYVQSGNAGGSFTIPEGVELRSIAPLQVVETQFGQVALPGSGQSPAARPVITDTVRLENNTMFSGFTVQPPANKIGVIVDNVNNVTITGNTITTRLDVIPSTIPVDPATNEPNFRFGSIVATNSNNVMIADNTINSSGDGNVGILGDSSSVTISGNTINTSGDTVPIPWTDCYYGWCNDRLAFMPVAGIRGNFTNVSIVGNTVNTQGGANITGIDIESYVEGANFSRTTGGPVTITGNNVTTTAIDAKVPVGPPFYYNPNSATGISASSAGGSVTIAGNTVTTAGSDEVTGISSSSPSYNSDEPNENNSVTITGNMVTASARSATASPYNSYTYASATGIQDSSYDIPLTITDNVVSASVNSGGSATGITSYRSYFGGRNDSPMTITGNTVTANAPGGSSSYPYFGASAIGISGSSGGPVAIVGNTVSAIGSSDATGISGSSVVCSRWWCWGDGPVTITDNTVSTTGSSSATGISASSYNGQVSITNNIVSAEGGSNVTGISSSSGGSFYSSSLAPVTISGNTIIVSARVGNENYGGATGISSDSYRYYSSSRDNNPIAITNNTINVSGPYSDGIRVSVSGDTSISYTIAGNTIEQAGRDGVRFEFTPYGEEFSSPTTCLALSNNVNQNSGNGVGYRLIFKSDEVSPVSSSFQIVDSSPTFADTQASNVGTFVFEPDITSFTNVPACP